MNEIEYEIACIANPYFDYPVENVDNIDKVDFPLEFVNSNKLSLLIKEKVKQIETIKKEEKIKYLMNELCNLKNDFEDNRVDFLLIKFPELVRPHDDLDILIINGLEKAEIILREKGYIFKNGSDPYRRGYTKINNVTFEADLHLEAAWVGIMYLDKEEIWENSIKRKINGVDIPVPSPEYELLIIAAHDMRSNEISLFDILYVHSILSNIDVEFARDVAKKNGWLSQFDYFIRLTSEIYMELYELGTFSKIKELPFKFPFYTISKLKLQKAILDLRHCGVKIAVMDLWAYYHFDIKSLLRRKK